MSDITPVWSIRNVPSELIKRISLTATSRDMTVREFVIDVLTRALESTPDAQPVRQHEIESRLSELESRINEVRQVASHQLMLMIEKEWISKAAEAEPGSIMADAIDRLERQAAYQDLENNREF